MLMAQLNDLVKSESDNKTHLISTAKRLADESIEITNKAKLLAQECTDKRMRNVSVNISCEQQ
jgi:vinculin